MKLEKVFAFELNAIPPYNFVFTVHKPAGWYWFTPFEVFENNTMWTAAQLSSGRIVGLKLRSSGDVQKPRISVQVFYRDEISDVERKEITDIVIEATGVNEDITGFYCLAKNTFSLNKL